MNLRAYQWGELLGILFLLASTAAQIFYVEPLRREIEWRLAAFAMQQNAQVQIEATYGTHIATLKALEAPEAAITAAETERDATLERFRTANANISDYLIDKEQVENYLQIIVIGLFAIGSLLAGFGRAMEMRASGKPE